MRRGDVGCCASAAPARPNDAEAGGQGSETAHESAPSSPDHLVGAQQDRPAVRDAHRLAPPRRSMISSYLRRLLNRQIGLAWRP